MYGINSLVGPKDHTFVFSDGGAPSNTWLDSFYREGPTTWATEVANNEYKSKENRPNYDPENYPGYTKMARAIDPAWLDIISLLTNTPG